MARRTVSGCRKGVKAAPAFRFRSASGHTARPAPSRCRKSREPSGPPSVHADERWEHTLAEFDEKALIGRLRVRDMAALGEVFARYGDAMTTLAASMLRNRTEADDVVEDALLRIHDAAPGFRGERGLRTWSLRIVANLCRDRLRRRKFTGTLPDEPDAFERAGLQFDPIEDWDGALDQRVMAAALERAIDSLPPDQREVVVLRHRLDLSHAEMAELLSVPEGTIKSRLARALAALREHLKGMNS